MPDTTHPMNYPYMLSHGYLKYISESVESETIFGHTVINKVTTYRVLKSYWVKNDASKDIHTNSYIPETWTPHPIGSTVTYSVPIQGATMIGDYGYNCYPAL